MNRELSEAARAFHKARPQRTRCSVRGGCSDIGGPCPSCICAHCDGRGYVAGDPEAAPIEDCFWCDSTGRYVERQL